MGKLDNYECDGQMSLFDIEPVDMHSDRFGRKKHAPKWMNKERCENCERWNMLDVKEQPPSGWGVYGWCSENKQRCAEISYCQNFENKNKMWRKING